MGFKDWRYKRRVKKLDRLRKVGKANYGRQDITPVKTELKGTLTARVYRAASDTWEPLEVNNVTVRSVT